MAKNMETNILQPVLLKPRLSEKTLQVNTEGFYVFDVPMKSNKAEIAKAVEKLHNVSVISVNTLIKKGKTARSIRIGNRKAAPVYGVRSDSKKAYVKLKKGDIIQLDALTEVQGQIEDAAPSKKKTKKESKK